MSRLSQTARDVIKNELDRAFFRAGRTLMKRYLLEISAGKAVEVCKSPKLLREALDIILSDAEQEARKLGKPEPLQFLAQTRNYPRQETFEKLKRIEAMVKKGPLEGTKLSAVAAVVNMTPLSLQSLIRRNNDHHKLVIRMDHIRLRSDVLLDIIAKRRAKSPNIARRLTQKGR
jgi:hypothetical protein